MTSGSIHNALAQIEELKRNVIDRKRFKGYSGHARAIGGTLALLTAAVVSSPNYPQNGIMHSTAYGILAAAGFTINISALLWWFFKSPDSGRDIRRLKPVFDALPPFLVGCALTITMLLNEEYNYLFCVWMCCYGLVNLTQNSVLPSGIRILGLYYVISGIVTLLVLKTPFLNPWPMGIVFFIGEWWGGILFYLNRMTEERANSSRL